MGVAGTVVVVGLLALTSLACVGGVGFAAAQLVVKPHSIAQDSRVPGVEHWWYEPGPWFVVHDDYAGFRVDASLVTDVYEQVN